MAKKTERRSYEVHLDAPEFGLRQQVGTLHRHETRTDVPPAFEYAPAWLQSASCFMLDPRLDLYGGEQHPPRGTTAFGIFMDSAPDRWGRVLMERREAVVAQREGRKMRALQDLDFLLGVHDLTRSGGLRLRAAPDPALAKAGRAIAPNPFLDDSAHAAPPVTDLQTLAHVSAMLEEPGVERMPEYERWLSMLIAPGTSLGGARPKANFTETDGALWIAKFPAHEDRHDVGGWEHVVHQLARRAGIAVPDSRALRFGEGYRTFCVRRFDRTPAGRRMYASAMTMLERQDGEEGASYLDLAEFIADNGAKGQVEADLAQLFRRMVFNILVANRDDHLRNHGFIRETTGWRLSAAFDINPNLAKAEHALSIDGHNASPDIDVALATAELYRLDAAAARAVLDEVSKVVGTWRATAEALGMAGTEMARMARLFES
ncbi:type II toxin-antitoxin system HipA family toxin [Variovorax sp. UMC13]|uniref:type II toxin-antitoxin system HipA family toxin n=1 Tax=Variovorax sp. UMC13 TaxID=1862326 RepID=UPI0016009110|nr:HipA domain-containing protein [Variovorax sp. UMC13]MBB1602870.1 hypothetical protein [Variovorax sp. UMC13]